MNMKKKYLTPEMEVCPLGFDGDLMTVYAGSGASNANLTIVEDTEEDEWVY